MTLTLAEIEHLRARAADAQDHVALDMDEDTFRGFYDRTARPLWSYLARVADPRDADDLLQETYYRLLRGRARYESEEHRRNALFAIATNVARDRRRRRRADPVSAASSAVEDLAAVPDRTAWHAEERADVGRAMERLKPRERGLLWLAYAQGWSHREIAGALGLRPASIKPLLFRARRRLAALLRAGAPGSREIGR